MPTHRNDAVDIGAGRALALEVHDPDNAPNGAVVILLHGGAWRFGHPSEMRPFAKVLTSQGFTAITAEYRLLDEAPWPAQRNDVVAVVQWVAAQARVRGWRQDAIVLQGFSAGGHLALLAASMLADVAAVIACFAPPSLVRDAAAPGPDPATLLLGPAANPADIAAASPIAQLHTAFPPTFLLAGVDDPLVPPQAMLAMFHALRAHNIATELHLYSGHTHEFARLPSMVGPVQAEVALFLDRNVVDPRRYTQENLALNMFARPGGPPKPLVAAQ